MGILLIFYALCLLASIYKIYQSGANVDKIVVIFFFMVFFCIGMKKKSVFFFLLFLIARIVLFSLNLTDVIWKNVTPGLRYFIVETPSYAYFTITILIIITW